MLEFRNPPTSNVYTTCICQISTCAKMIDELVTGISENLAYLGNWFFWPLENMTFRLFGIQMKNEYISDEKNISFCSQWSIWGMREN